MTPSAKLGLDFSGQSGAAAWVAEQWFRPAHRETNKGQEAMHKSVIKVWREIAHWFEPIMIREALEALRGS